ncbi:MAG: sigma-54 dependent transcriptional regulator, partial [Bdellovibrionota bacterium]
MLSKILVIDDDQICLDSYRRILNGLEREVDYFSNAAEAIEAFKIAPFSYSLAFVDYQYRSPMGIQKIGVDLITQLKDLNPMLTACIVSGDESKESLHSWLESAIDNYIYKPLRKSETMAFAEHHILKYERDFKPVKSYKLNREGLDALEKMALVGESESIIECAKTALRFAQSDLNVLLLGETGTGKELFAQGIHNNSANKNLGLYPINCSNYKENSQLLEVELFGSEKGAFTGAERKVGIFELARGGTVFLDEIHHLSEAAQSKLLRVLQEKKIRRVGGQQEYSVKFRLIAAGKPELIEQSKEGRFSPDLYFRLKGLDLIIPPLRDRKRDIRSLVTYSLQKIKNRTGQERMISNRAMEYLEKYDWPGNIRELLQVLEKINVMIDDDLITPKHLPEDIRNKPAIKGQVQTLN